MVTIPRTGRSASSVELPDEWTEPAEVSRLLDQAAVIICEEWQSRRRSRASASRAASDPSLEKTCYDVLTGFLKAQQSDAFEDRIRRYKRYSRGIRGNTNIFQIGMMAIAAHDRDVISPRDRERVGKRLWHAYRHYVPPAFLTGFFKQLDSHNLLGRAAENQIEPGFDEWIAQQLSGRDQSHERGIYPLHIVKLSERLSLKRAHEWARGRDDDDTEQDDDYIDDWD